MAARAILVLLYLLEGDAEAGGELGLIQPQDNSTLTDALANALIDLDITRGTVPLRLTCHHDLHVS